MSAAAPDLDLGGDLILHELEQPAVPCAGRDCSHEATWYVIAPHPLPCAVIPVCEFHLAVTRRAVHACLAGQGRLRLTCSECSSVVDGNQVRYERISL